jgi:hypothetical protein
MTRASSNSKDRAPDAAQDTPAVPAVLDAEVLATAVSKDKDVSLPQLAKRIRKSMGRVVKGAVDSVRAAMDAGDDLIMAKDKVGHGGWMNWLEKNCALSDRTARQYMQLAEGREYIEQQIKDVTELACNANFSLGFSANFTIARAIGVLQARENIATTSGGKATIGPKQRRETQVVEDMTPEEFLSKMLVPIWPPAKLLKLAELITTQFKQSDASEQQN